MVGLGLVEQADRQAQLRSQLGVEAGDIVVQQPARQAVGRFTEPHLARGAVGHHRQQQIEPLGGIEVGFQLPRQLLLPLTFIAREGLGGQRPPQQQPIGFANRAAVELLELVDRGMQPEARQAVTGMARFQQAQAIAGLGVGAAHDAFDAGHGPGHCLGSFGDADVLRRWQQGRAVLLDQIDPRGHRFWSAADAIQQTTEH